MLQITLFVKQCYLEHDFLMRIAHIQAFYTILNSTAKAIFATCNVTRLPVIKHDEKDNLEQCVVGKIGQCAVGGKALKPYIYLLFKHL